MDIYRPTYLYIKQRTITGKLYFGKTVKNPETYLGSGVHWLKHIKKHGKEHVVNLWYCLFLDEESISQFAIGFSEQHNIVESDDWLNLIGENGCDGAPSGIVFSKEHKENLSKARAGNQKVRDSLIGNKNSTKPKSESHKLNISIAAKRRTTIQCPHCGKVGDPGNMTRHHFDNCKTRH